MQFSRPFKGQSIRLGQFLDSNDHNDPFELFVFVKHLQDFCSDVKLSLSHDIRVHKGAGRLQGVNGGIESGLNTLTGQDHDGIQIAKDTDHRGIRDVISRHEDSLKGSDGTVLSGADPLLKTAHFRK